MEREMRRQLTLVSLHSREGLALVFALAVVLLIAVLSVRAWAASGSHADQLEVTQRTVSAVNALFSLLTDAETGQRGFLLTGEDRYLGPYREARAEIPMLMKSLGAVSRGLPEQAKRIESLNPLVSEKLEELERTIELRNSQGLDAALAVVRTDRGRVLMNQVRRLCSQIEDAALDRLTLYSEQARSSGYEGGLISILGGAILFVLLLVANIGIQKEVRRRQLLIHELQQSEQRLEHAAAQAQAANRAKSTFLSTMSHELRTPMNAVLGYAQLMLRDPGLGADAKANLKIIGRSGEHLLTLINDVLDMSKIEAGRTELSPTTFSVAGLLERLAVMFRLRAEQKGLRFEMSVGGELVPYIVGDEGKIGQVLINLLGNAIKFTAQGGVKLHVTFDRRSGNRSWFSALVEDTGSGMTSEEQKQLFEPFSQVEGGLHAHEGTGLGLAISRKYARLMEGDITVTSSPGIGSIFKFEIPIECGDAGTIVERIHSRRVVGIVTATEAPRILVVDDVFENRDWLMKLLASIGFCVRGAVDGEAAIRSWEEWSPRLILMDMHMPVMDGLEATRRIKADLRGKGTVIIALSASVLDDDRRAVSESGADDFLSKPFREDELFDKVQSALHITYQHEEPSDGDGQSHAGTSLPPAASLVPLPRELVEEIRHATLSGNKRLLDQLILKVRDTEDAGSANALQELAGKYEYDALMRLLEEVCRR